MTLHTPQYYLDILSQPLVSQTVLKRIKRLNYLKKEVMTANKKEIPLYGYKHVFDVFLKLVDASSFIFGEKNKTYNIIRGSTHIADIIIKAIDNEDYMLDSLHKEYTFLPEEIVPLVVPLILKFPSKQIKKNPQYSYSEFSVKNFKLIASIENDLVSGVCCKTEDIDKLINFISTEFWNTFTNNVKLDTISKQESNFGKSKHKTIMDLIPKTDVPIKAYYPDQFNDIYDYLIKFINKKVSRAIILYGPPGTGKTTTAKLLSQKLGLKTLVLNPLSVTRFEYTNIEDICEYIKPECVILDDFDKIKLVNNYDRDGSIFRTIEILNSKIKLILSTVNDLEYVKKDKSLIRPGRFDKFFLIDKIDNRVVLDIIGRENSDLLSKIDTWPAAYIAELKKTINVLGKSEAIKYIDELNDRVIEQNSDYKYLDKLETRLGKNLANLLGEKTNV